MVVNAIVDTLKTAFPRSEPQSPTEELSEAETDGKPQTEGKKASKWAPTIAEGPSPHSYTDPRPQPNGIAHADMKYASPQPGSISPQDPELPGSPLGVCF